MFFAKLFIFINMVFLDMLNEKRFENYLLFPIFATNIFLLWYNLTCFFKSHFSRNLSSQISKAVCYGIFSYASSSRLRKILSRKMIQLRNLCSPCRRWALGPGGARGALCACSGSRDSVIIERKENATPSHKSIQEGKNHWSHWFITVDKCLE